MPSMDDLASSTSSPLSFDSPWSTCVGNILDFTNKCLHEYDPSDGKNKSTIYAAMAETLANASQIKRFDGFQAWYACSSVLNRLDGLSDKDKGHHFKEWLVHRESSPFGPLCDGWDPCMLTDSRRYRTDYFYFPILDIIGAYPKSETGKIKAVNETESELQRCIEQLLVEITSFGQCDDSTRFLAY